MSSESGFFIEEYVAFFSAGIIDEETGGTVRARVDTYNFQLRLTEDEYHQREGKLRDIVRERLQELKRHPGLREPSLERLVRVEEVDIGELLEEELERREYQDPEPLLN
jgi:hypothetical protein